MHNYKITLEYNGANFFGSQIQPKDTALRTVQAELEKILNECFGPSGYLTTNPFNISTSFSSRTDAGVHAIGQVVNFMLENPIPDLENNFDKILITLNSKLSEDIAIVQIEEVNLDFHSRFNAKSREYLYKIFVRRHRPVLRLDSLMWQKEPLDFERMAEHAKTFIGTHDFSRFAKTKKSAVCTVYESELIRESKICFKYKIKANRFMRHMVRRIVGELIKVGKGLEPNKESSRHMAPAAGLTLIKVEY